MSVASREHDPAMTWAVPQLSGLRIARHRLDHHFAAARGRVIRVLAPAGYGKTSLVARWVENDDRHVSWVDVARGDDDPVTMYTRLCAALDGVVRFPDPHPTRADDVQPYVDSIRFGMTLASSSAPFVLVLDDVHRLRSEPTAWIVEALAERLPAASTIVLVGRGHSDHGSIGRLRLAPGVVDVGVDDLVFDEAETHRLLVDLSIDPNGPGMRRTVSLLEGWPAGLRLAAGAIDRGVDPPEVADHAALVDYLRQEWLHTLDTEALHFLREVACFERFTATMCDAVLERRTSRDLLERLHHHDHLLFGLDQRAEWYRLHPVLRRWLANDLRQCDPDRWRDVHHRAAEFWRKDGDVARAVDHLRTIEDLIALEEVVIAHGGPFLTRGMHATVTSWLSSFPPEHVRASPGLCSLHCIAALHNGDETRAIQWTRLADIAVAERRGPPDQTAWWATLLSITLERRAALELLPRAAATRDHLTSGPWAAFACWVHGALAFMAGHTDDARASLARGAFEGELTDNPMVRSNCLATHAVIDEIMGDVDAALVKSRQAADLRRECGGDALPPAAIGLATAALLDARTGRPDQAARQVTATREVLAGFPTIGPWFNVLARIPLVQTTLLLDDRTASLELMQELEKHARLDVSQPAGSTNDVVDHVAELRRRVDAMHRPATGASSLTTAELKVLQLMPTNLSLADIAGRLYVSRNTIKTHAASIYRKLGAENRTQAVTLAAAAGLLAEPSRHLPS